MAHRTMARPSTNWDDDEAFLLRKSGTRSAGEAWDEFTSGYSDGWVTGCDVAFEGSPDGSLYDQGSEYTIGRLLTCLDPGDASAADHPLEIPADPYSEGEVLGETDAARRGV
jgi:hypothetical protein